MSNNICILLGGYAISLCNDYKAIIWYCGGVITCIIINILFKKCKK